VFNVPGKPTQSYIIMEMLGKDLDQVLEERG
jgi:serine/threonine protein kinase